MKAHTLHPQDIDNFARYLQAEERSPGTIANYLRDVRRFAAWLGAATVTREAVSAWKQQLAAEGLAATTINAKLAALNGLLRFLGWDECRAHFLKVQRRVFRSANRELSREEYERLLASAHAHGKRRLALAIETLCAAGLRVSELAQVTVEAAQHGRTEVHLKGKVRTILLPKALCKKLLHYAHKQKITRGEIFLTARNRPLGRHQLWAEMKQLAKLAGIAGEKVFPHNLRHLFASQFYAAYQDIVRLADVLGHSSVETTRIYIASSGAEHQRQLDALALSS